MTLPIIGITMGDPAGVGPEVIVGAYNAGLSNLECHPIVIGNADRLRDAARIMGHDVQINTCMSVDDAVFDNGKTINCIDAATVPSDFPYGKNTQLGGEVAFQCVKRATKMAVKNEIQAICTAPLSKEAIHMAGHMYPGHTEMIADLTNTKEASMMLTAPNLRVIHITTHIGLIDAIYKIEPGLVFRTIERGHTALVQMLGREPRIGVCAINPHAGEGGLFGNGEEAEKITPAIEKANTLGWSVTGPLAADTLFFVAARGDYDLVVAMYHDQGHGPVKAMGIEAGVNISVGLPVIRTSVDHGTAFDIAGKGIADERSMTEALRHAVEFAGRKK